MKDLKALFGPAAAFLLLAPILAACGTSAPTRYYTLSPSDIRGPVPAVVEGASRTVVGVGAVEIPDYLDRPQIVVRTSQHQFILAEADLWVGSFKADVSRVLLENLTHALPADRFSAVALKRGVSFDCKVTVTIIRLDVEPEEGALLHAQWAISDKDGKGDGRVRSTRLVERAATKDISGAVAAMSRALGRLGGEIAEEISARAY